uniref:PCI domain-containing protein n=1 Tax=Ditylum brightwellii TaxID=49249 RepID=A0A6U3NR12_9STRA|mmetsp:Transcript_1064/g.1733  ORF Transcript_1064/g.1733 Transcript_1064/m.1733 type:complete len:414 (+) Transcript_1064:185-1426(+)
MSSYQQRRKLKKDELKSALSTKDPYRVAAVLEIPSLSSSSSSGAGVVDRGIGKEEHLKIDNVEWGGVLGNLIEACECALEGNVIKCYEAHSSLHSSLNSVFASTPGNWLLPALHTTCRNTHTIAIAADVQHYRTTGRNDHSKLQNAVTLLQESFSKTLNDRKEYKPGAPLDENGSKKAGVLYIVNRLFAMYFRLNTLRLCKNLLRPIESRSLHEVSENKGDKVTYRYYVGRLAMFEDQYDVAEEHLDYALKHCYRGARGNKKRILNYLLPVKLLRGRLPTQYLLQKYSLHEFIPLVHGIRTGDLRTFNDGLQKYQDLFIRRGTYLLLEKCKTVCYRNLFKRVSVVTQRAQLPLNQVATSFKWLGMSIDLDEVECILANLIFRGYVRGYISHSKRILVLSKKDPFPVSAVVARG